jgi:hypothetical protein
MRKTLLALTAACLCLAGAMPAQNLAIENFEGVVVPQVMSSTNANRIPFVYRARVTGLDASTTYRYFSRMAEAADIGTATVGAGNPMLISSDGSTYTYTTSPSLTGTFETFTTNASGEYEGWFGFVHTGNARFSTPGNIVRPTIEIGDNTGTLLHRRALDMSVTVLLLSTTAGGDNATGIYGSSSGTAKTFVMLYDNTAGTGRPVSGAWIESTGTSIPFTPTFWSTNVAGQAGRWGTLIPNALPNGIRRIEARTTANTIYWASTDADGVWPGGANTVDPTGGTTALVITSSDAPLPVELDLFQID